MKYLLPLALTIVLTSCAITPEDQQAAHQRNLEKEARANFIAMKAQEHPGQQVVLNDEARPAPKQGLFGGGQAEAVPTSRPVRHPQPTPVVRPVFASSSEPWYAHSTRPRSSRDDTVYYWQVETIRSRTTPREKAAEAQYAKKLAKHPEDLTPEERLWAHEHF
jgi:hypothetical protein